MVDVQARLVPAMHDFGAALANQRRLIQGGGILGIPVVVTEQYPKGLGPTIPSIASLVPGPYVEKLAFGCFGCEPFRQAVDGRRDLILCGLEAHVCVLQTALGGLAAGHRVFVAADAVTSRTPGNRDLALAQLARAGAVVASTETLLFQLLVAAGSDEFRAVSKLVR
ncbi:MAG: hydrolase [Armatimonadetes bacterium]|nr:hydrolase [Armatimonadota bacterium]